MQTLTISASLELQTEECCNCHMIFAMPKDLRRRLIESREVFFCPAGHGQSYNEKYKVGLEEQLVREKKYREEAEARVRDARADARRQLIERRKLQTRNQNLKTRIANGVCPCCHRSFENLRRHITSQHPGFKPVNKEAA